MTVAVDTITTILTLLIIVVASGMISRELPLPVPRPLVQITSGAVIGLSTKMQVPLEPNVFFLLFVPPLLFLDGWRIPTEELRKDWATIAQLSLGLVIATVFGVGLFIHWMNPTIPFAGALALAAVLSPTDPISVSSIAGRIHFPRRLMQILQGESLLNDATGLICMRFAMAFLLTGTFSMGDATLSFVWLAGAGIVTGIGVTLLIARGKDWVSRQIEEESGPQIVISLLIPFLAYLAAEALRSSGIFAAVSAGITMRALEASGRALGSTRMHRNTVWDTVQFIAQGVVFVLLGEQLPTILKQAVATESVIGRVTIWWLVLDVLAIYAAILIVRLIWVSISFTLHRARMAEGVIGSALSPGRLIAAASLAGVRGAISLAGVLSLPILLADGTRFPARDLSIFIAAGVVLVSLVVAGFGLPLLLGSEALLPDLTDDAERRRARLVAAKAAIAEIEKIKDAHINDEAEAALYAAAATLIADTYRHRIEKLAVTTDPGEKILRSDTIERQVQLAALKAERLAIFRQRGRREIGSETAGRLVRELDLLEAHLEALINI